MSDKQRKLRLVFFLLLSAIFVGAVVSCQAPQSVDVAAFSQYPQVVHERETADIGTRIATDAGNVPAGDFLTFAQSFGFSYEAAGRTKEADGKARTPNDDSASCVNCHSSMSNSYTDSKGKKNPAAYHNMHDPAITSVMISCVDCHGGNGDAKYNNDKEHAHVQPTAATRHLWVDPNDPNRISPVNPQNLAAQTLAESPDYIRFVNPGDLRASWVSCYACHADAVRKISTNMMVHGDMLWEAALYNNGTINRKNAIYGEFYDWENLPARVVAKPAPTPEETKTKGWLPELWPLPRWEASQPGNILRVFERGGERRPVIGIPDIEEDSGRPDVKLSVRGFGTEVRTDPVLIGLQKTRLLDPTLNFFGTNDHPGDYRASGCSACHVVYANDSSPVHSGIWAKYGNRGQTASSDVSLTDYKEKSGQPILHYFVQQMPISTCIVCHIHPGTNVVNSYTGFMWWDNETDGRLMYPKEQRNPDGEDEYVSWKHNPEGAAIRGLWSDLSEFAETAAQKLRYSHEQDQLGRPAWDDFLERLADLNNDDALKHTTFADFHGHGWVFRAVYKKDRYGNLLDADGKKITDPVTRQELTDAVYYQQQFNDKGEVTNPKAPQQPVHLKDIHLEMGMQCADCHFEQDNHGDGHLYGETRDAVAEDCIDCHGTAEQPAALLRFLTEKTPGVQAAVRANKPLDQFTVSLKRQLTLAQANIAKTKTPSKALIQRRDTAQKNLDTAIAAYNRATDEYNRIWSGSAAAGKPGYNDLAHFEIRDGRLFQKNLAWSDDKTSPAHSLPEGWYVTQTVDTLNKDSGWAKSATTRPWYTEDGTAIGDHFTRAAYAHTVRRDMTWGDTPTADDTAPSHQLAHPNSTVSCYACHTSWNTSCFGCHLPQRANEQKTMQHNEGTETRNYTTYNYQTLRDDMYMLGDDGTVKGHKVVPVRSACAVLVSSQDALRRWIYVQQQTVSAEGYAGTAFSPYYPHTVRANETRQCSDCHMHKDDEGHVDNNAVMAQLLMQGVNAYNFIGRFCWVGCGDEGLQAIAVTERDEPQAVFGSRLHEEAYPDNYSKHVANGLNLTESYEHTGEVLDVQQRGEYTYAACGPNGFIAYDIANIDDKDFSERITLAPVSPLGQRFYIPSQDATSICSPSTLAINPAKQLGDQDRPENEEQPMTTLMYAFLYLTDSKEGLIVIGNPLDSPNGPGVSTLLNGNPQDNFLERAVTFNPNNILAGARHCDLYGTYAWISCNAGIVIVDLKDPLHPRVVTTLTDAHLPRKTQFQFRYAFVVDQEGLKVFDVTDPESPVHVQTADTPIADARDIYLSRTYAYIAGGRQGMLIYDIERPEVPKLDQTFAQDPATGIKLDDVTAIKVAMTNASMYAYVADGRNGLRVLQLTSSDDRDDDPGHSDWQFLGFSPHPHPRLIAQFHTPGPALCISKGLDRDRAVDESGNQLSVFGRRGSHPFTLAEQQRMYLLEADDGHRYPFFVQDAPPSDTHVYKPDASRFKNPGG